MHYLWGDARRNEAGKENAAIKREELRQLKAQGLKKPVDPLGRGRKREGAFSDPPVSTGSGVVIESAAAPDAESGGAPDAESEKTPRPRPRTRPSAGTKSDDEADEDESTPRVNQVSIVKPVANTEESSPFPSSPSPRHGAPPTSPTPSRSLPENSFFGLPVDPALFALPKSVNPKRKIDFGDANTNPFVDAKKMKPQAISKSVEVVPILKDGTTGTSFMCRRNSSWKKFVSRMVESVPDLDDCSSDDEDSISVQFRFDTGAKWKCVAGDEDANMMLGALDHRIYVRQTPAEEWDSGGEDGPGADEGEVGGDLGVEADSQSTVRSSQTLA